MERNDIFGWNGSDQRCGDDVENNMNKMDEIEID